MSEKRLGDYILDRKLATGGMAEIWLGHKAGPAGFSKQVVIKKILPHLAEDRKFVEMFIDEARLAAQLEHPNIVQIFDLGEIAGDYFIAMEFIDGWDLEAVVNRVRAIGRTVPPAFAARVLADACTALDYAHNFTDSQGRAADLVHRDISPQNILVSRSGTVKVVDFGVAKAATSSHKTQTGAVKGKLSYMSPEQITAKPLDGRSDIFALGIVLYELLTGVRPFGHDSELLAVTAILHEQPRQPSELHNDIPFELENIILRALQKDPRDRFQSCGEMHVALEQALRSRGEILTNRDVAKYLEDLFSANPSGDLKPHTSAIGIAGAYAPGGHTLEHISATPTTMVQPGTLRAAHARATGGADEEPAPRRSGGGMLAAVVLFVLVGLGGAGFGIWHFVLKATDEPGAAASVEGTGDAATAAQPQAGGTTSDSTEAPPVLDADAGVDSNVVALPVNSQATNEANKPGVASLPVPATTANDGTTQAATPTNGSGASVAIVAPADVDTGGAAAEADAGAAANAQPDATEPVAVETPDTGAERDTARRDSGASGEQSSSRDPGTLRITLTTGGRATVYVDGSEIGTVSGTRSFPVPAGSRRVRVVSTTGGDETREVTIRAGQTSVLSLSF